MVDDSVIHRTLAAALRNGGDFAEVFVEDKHSTSAMLDDRRVEDLVSDATAAPASGSWSATPPASRTPPT